MPNSKMVIYYLYFSMFFFSNRRQECFSCKRPHLKAPPFSESEIKREQITVLSTFESFSSLIVYSIFKVPQQLCQIKNYHTKKRSNDIFEYPLQAKSIANFQLNINLYDEIKVLKLTVSASFSVCAASSEDKMKLIATVFLLIWVQFECDLCKKGKRFQIVFNRNNRQYAISSKSFHSAAVLALKVISASFHCKSTVVSACRKLTVLKLFHSTKRKLQLV